MLLRSFDARTKLRATTVLSKLDGASSIGAPIIGTHSGSFHCDEALATGMLRLLPQFRDSPVLRSRDKAALSACALQVDVGAEYDASRGRLDHHQAGFTETYSAAHTIKLSSAGLVYKHYGADVLKAIIGSPALDDHILNKLVARTYDHFVAELDAIDNGVERYHIESYLGLCFTD